MKIISSILFLVLLQSFTVAQAQYVVNKGFVEDALRARVKLVDEFMRRFNCQKLLPGLDTTNQDYKQLNLLSLFDSEMFGVKESDSLYFQARQLVADALENDVTLSYSDTSWIACALCHGRFVGKEVSFFVFLNTEISENNICKWVVSKVYGDFLSLAPPDTSSDIMMVPGCHETNFMELKRITTENDKDILNYANKRFQVDQTSVFFAFVNAGLLEIEYVDSLEFVFFQVPCWQFTIRKFERLDKNSGWLISSFSRMDDHSKVEFLNSMRDIK